MTHPQLDDAMQSLPPHLLERARKLSGGKVLRSESGRVVYWTHHALRCDENPALDAAVHLANTLELPLVVYQGLSERYRFASDRHHTFILQAAEELQREYSVRGIPYVLHVERRGFRGPRLAQLAATSSVIVTDDFPVEATRQWTERLCSSRAAIVAADTACVVPMQKVGRAFDRAFAFRSATEKLFRERWKRSWPECPKLEWAEETLPFSTLDLNRTSVAEVVAQCDIDHSIGPVPDTRGGGQAGYARWNAFVDRGLTQYAKRRNAIEIDGVSRMSAYLHYGMVSPMRIAREAAALLPKEGAEKYLDELLIWRELAYGFCFYRDDVDSCKALPQWAVATLDAHAQDPRSALSWETLARAQTGQALWDAAQRSLLKHGELHNNVRMTWGKAILQWSSDYKQALQRMIDLNHRYALDGRDPASYGGILWCLGQFDRPFTPEQPVFGTVRTRPLEEHQRRVKLDAYERHVDRAVYPKATRVAIIGAGLGGLICARTLSDHGIKVQVFDKSRRPGGRAATRVQDTIQFDHGAQYFTIRDPRMKQLAESWLHDGHIARWEGRIVEIKQDGTHHPVSPLDRYVAVPYMNSLGQHLASGLNIAFDTQVQRVERNNKAYVLVATEQRRLGEFDVVLWNCPPKQIVPMLPEMSAESSTDASNWRDQLSSIAMQPCWAVMCAFENRWEVDLDGAFINHGSLSWIARDSSKPGRTRSHDCWVLHASPQWTAEHLNASPEEVITQLTAEAQRVTGVVMPRWSVAHAHRWLYARPEKGLDVAALWDSQRQLGACGDWCDTPRVEGALLSGIALAGQVMGSLNVRQPSHSYNLFDDLAVQSSIEARG